MLVINRFRVADASFRDDLESVRAVLAGCEGCLEARVGRNVDDPELWVLSTRWQHVGAYRRALSSYDVKVGAWPVLATAIDEPSAYEVVESGTPMNRAEPRATG